MYKIYETLLQLEYENKTNSERYILYKNYLNVFISLEDEIINLLKLDGMKSANLSKYIENNYDAKPDSAYNIPTVINYDKSVFIRMQNILLSYCTKDLNCLKEMFTNDGLNEENINNKIKEIIMTNIIITDVLIVYINELNNSINDEINRSIKYDLIKAKYFTLMSNKDLEIDNTNLYSCSKLYADIMGIKEEDYLKQKDKLLNKIATCNIKKILEIKDIDYIDKNLITSSVLYSLMIKSSLSLMSENNFNKFKNRYYKYIDYFKQRNSYNKISQSIINSFLNNGQIKDIKILSLNK